MVSGMLEALDIWHLQWFMAIVGHHAILRELLLGPNEEHDAARRIEISLLDD